MAEWRDYLEEDYDGRNIYFDRNYSIEQGLRNVIVEPLNYY